MKKETEEIKHEVSKIYTIIKNHKEHIERLEAKVKKLEK